MASWSYTEPVDIIFGDGKISEIAAITSSLHLERGLLIAGPHLIKDGTAQKIIDLPKSHLTDLFGNISPNPDVTEVDACADLIRTRKNDFIVAVGGGSCLDLAKAAGCISGTEDSVRKYHGTGIPLPNHHIPLIAVPTTAGTGSEVTSVSVLSDHMQSKKAPIVSDSLYPDWAIVDPLLTISMPPQITASTGIDTLCHAVEGYWSKNHQPISDALAVHAADLVFKWLLTAYQHGDDEVARDKMCEASLIAGLAFNLPKTTASHACSFPLTNLYGIPHGEACALTLPYFMEVNARGPEGDRIASFAIKLGFSSADELADGIRELQNRMGMRTDLKDLHLTDDQLDELVKLSHHPNMLNNPVEITDEILYDMYGKMK